MIRRITELSAVDTEYDFIIVGTGLSGIVHAEQLSLHNHNAKILMVEQRDHIGGNCFTQKVNDIDVHIYGSHIFHTNHENVWAYINQFTEFNDYKHRVMADTDDEICMLPFTMVTFMQIFGVSEVDDVKAKIQDEVNQYFDNNIPAECANFEDQAIALVGTTIYNKLIKHYTQKQWGRHPSQLPAEIIKRLPLRWNTDTTYFNNAKYQGIAKNGYTEMMENMLKTVNHLDILISANFNVWKSQLLHRLKSTGKLIYTGALDELLSYTHGALDYRSLKFRHHNYEKENFQGTAVVNYTGIKNDFTRITEHKHYSMNAKILQSPHTTISIEYPIEHIPGQTIPYYPIGDEINTLIHQKYVELFKATYPNAYASGRLADYKYYDMDATIYHALLSSSRIIDDLVMSTYTI